MPPDAPIRDSKVGFTSGEAAGAARTQQRIGLALAGWGVTYLLLGTVGLFFLIYKTLVMPVFLAYAAVVPEARRRAYLRAWIPFLAGTVAFDLARGGIYKAVQAGVRPEFTDYVIAWEQAWVGVPALPLILQQWHSPVLEGAAIALHVLHFVYFLLIGILVWHVNERNGLWLQRTMLLIMGLGLFCYFLVPTVPPWLAADRGVIPQVRHTVVAFYHAFIPQLHYAFDTNPVAAMPSLHTAFPMACAIIGCKTFSRPVGALLWGYVVALGLAVVYLGEHYLVDVAAGAVFAAVCASIVAPRDPAAPRSF
ncbi:MAG: phosphatase PAP2 family protein [Vicinamibacterales bacterium]